MTLDLPSQANLSTLSRTLPSPLPSLPVPRCGRVCCPESCRIGFRGCPVVCSRRKGRPTRHRFLFLVAAVFEARGPVHHPILPQRQSATTAHDNILSCTTDRLAIHCPPASHPFGPISPAQLHIRLSTADREGGLLFFFFFPGSLPVTGDLERRCQVRRQAHRGIASGTWASPSPHVKAERVAAQILLTSSRLHLQTREGPTLAAHLHWTTTVPTVSDHLCNDVRWRLLRPSRPEHAVTRPNQHTR